MPMTLQDLRSFVYEHLDIDDDDLSQTVLDGFIREAFDDIAQSDYEFQHFQFDATFDTEPGVQSYDLSAIGTDPPTNVQSIQDVRSDTQQLRPRDHRQMRQAFRQDATHSGRPTLYSRWGNQLHLWPIPDTELSIGVTGYRKPNDWIADGAGGVPDLPDEFHLCVAFGACALAYAHQDDHEAAILYSQRNENRLRRLRKQAVRPLDAQPLVLNRGNRGLFHERNGLGGLSVPYFDWE